MSQLRHASPRKPDLEPQPALARGRITAAAFRLFAQKGYSCTSVQDIADAAEVKKSILYYYFRSKEGLYRTLFRESATTLRGCLMQSLVAVGCASPTTESGWREELPAAISCETLLAELAETLIALARDNLESVRFFMSHIFASDADRPLASLEEMEHVMPQFFRHIALGGIERGELQGDPADLERVLLGALQYSIIRHLRSPEQEPLLPGLGRRIVHIVLGGFSSQKASAETSHAKRPGKSSKRRPVSLVK